MEIQPNKEVVKLLAETKIFLRLKEEELAELATMLIQKKYVAGEELFREGDPGGNMFIIASGSVEVQKLRSHGSGRVVIARFERAGVIGEMSLVDHMPRSATVVAMTPTVVYEFSKTAFKEMLGSQKDLSIDVLKGLAHLLAMRLRNTSGWFADVF
ncbi:MAG: cyclic nucleotide-binding domain-containing protein [Calditrichaeota bacterium]|nr:cyclic nucleotide-binding domain-containing protein [Calditrichota bacterium]MBT7617643.1 cyclic nucleotide-binding domain-containing protein [Calditrichota bacterium]MBT7789993.1 cyclic nucleotide-binding domain-containing protein [Calditrichota bacterium]